MTDEAESPEIEEVRRLLADARHTSPMPDDVAARMHETLADLSADRAGTAQTGEPATGESRAEPLAPAVVSLAAHRRRRAAGLLVAAAAIVVGGVALAQHLPGGGQASPAAGGERSAATAQGNTGNAQGQAVQPPSLAPGTAGARVQVKQGRVLVRPRHFTADALAGRRLLAAKASVRRLGIDVTRPGCVHVPPDSQFLRSLYRGAPAVLVYHHPAGTSQVVDLFVCGSTRPLRSVTLPMP